MITILSTPTSPLKSFTPTLFRVTSSDAATRRVSGTFVGQTGSGDVRTITLSAQVDLGSTSAYSFDMQEFVRDNLAYDIQAVGLPVEPVAANNSIFRIVAQQYTELLNSNGQLVNGDTETDTVSTFVFLNAVRQVDESESLTDYIMDAINTRKFLTNSPRTLTIRPNESHVLSVYGTSLNINALSVNFRTADGTSISNQIITFGTPRTLRYDIPVGLANLVAEGVTIPSNAYDYRISIGFQSGSYIRYSEFFVFRINNDCVSDGLRVHFLNKLGGFDSFTFTDVTVDQVTTTSTLYEKNLGSTFNQQSRGRQTQYRNAFESYQATSGIINRAEAEWLTELLTTAVAYIERNGKLYSVTINDGRFTSFDPLNLTQLRLTFTLSNDVRNQRL